jgi:uncharacterized protein (TIGR03086 family)
MTGMSSNLHEAVAGACTGVAAVLADPPDGVDLHAVTPCPGFDLRALVDHFVGTSSALARVGLGEPLDAANPWGGGDGAADGDWSGRLRSNLDAIGRGWSRPETWAGEVEVGGSAMPRSMVGEMALVEVTMHGWDVARALGRTLELEPEVAGAVHRAAASTAELGRRMGAYGPEVPVPAGAPALDRALGQTGRDPSWIG